MSKNTSIAAVGCFLKTVKELKVLIIFSNFPTDRVLPFCEINFHHRKRILSFTVRSSSFFVVLKIADVHLQHTRISLKCSTSIDLFNMLKKCDEF